MAELLIALAILGVIATFAIPKVLNAQQDQRLRAVQKETIAAMSSLFDMGCKTGYAFDYSNVGPYVREHINALKDCPSARTDGCWTHHNDTNANDYTAGFVLHNGAVLTGFGGGSPTAVDWNGAEGPNTLGEDQWEFYVCLSGVEACRPSPGARSAYCLFLPNGPVTTAAYNALYEK